MIAFYSAIPPHTVQWNAISLKNFREIDSLIDSKYVSLTEKMTIVFRHVKTHSTVWENEKFALTEKMFRQINYYLVILLVESSFPRKKCDVWV